MKPPVSPPAYPELLSSLSKSPGRLAQLAQSVPGPAPQGKYRHWHTLRHLKPPADLTPEEWWCALKMWRMSISKEIPLRDATGRPFRFSMPDPAQELVHSIDRDASGRIEISEQVTNPATRDRHLVSSLIEEAITSSQLEGAATTRRMAEELIRSGRRPRDHGERMVVNNFNAMKAVRELRGKALTPDLVLDLQRILTADTLEARDAAGRFRKPEEPIGVWDPRDGELLHRPPVAEELPRRMEEMCAFANGKTPDFFVHPVVRATILHFWLAYDHPFVDGNGRTARAVFYWSMLSHGYWLSEYISVSSVLKRSPGQYMRAYLYTETDDNDLTYFILFNLRAVRLAIERLHEYLRVKMSELRRTEALLKRSAHFNHRQIALLSHALRHPDAQYSIQSHRTSHNVVHQTARTDLLDLVRKGVFVQRKVGRRFYFHPLKGLADRMSKVR
jgi:Fic family protein